MKRIITLIFFVLIFSSGIIFGQVYELSFTGSSFIGINESEDYAHSWGWVWKTSTDGYLDCPVQFPPSANGMNVSRLSISCLDNSSVQAVKVRLYKVDRWTATETGVAWVESAGVSPAIQFRNQPKSQMKATGIDSNRYAWILSAEFSSTNSLVRLYTVTIRYE